MAQLTSASKPLTNYEVRLEIEKIYERHAKAYENKHGKPFCNVADGKGYTQQVVPNVSRYNVEQAREGVDGPYHVWDVLIFAFDPENGPLFRYSTRTSMNRPFWWLGGIVMITRHAIYWKTPRSPLKHSLPLKEIRRFTPVPPSEQGEAAENEIRLCYRDSNKQDAAILGFPPHFIDFLNEALRFLQAHPDKPDMPKPREVAPVPQTPLPKLTRRLTDEEIAYGVAAIYRKYELFYAQNCDLDLSEPENSDRDVSVVPNIPTGWDRFKEYIEYMAPQVKPEEVLIFAYCQENPELFGPGTGVLITRRKIYWVPPYTFKPSKYSEYLSSIESFVYQENPKPLSKSYEMFVKRKKAARPSAEEEASVICHFSEHHTAFLNEVLAFLQSNP